MTPEEIAAMQADLKASKDEIAKMKTDAEAERTKLENEKKNKKVVEDDDLLAKAKKEQKDKEDAAKGDKSLEAALSFNLTVFDFVKNNKDILPSDFAKILELSGKESYDSPKQKANAIRSGLIQSFFSVQANNELLTDNQKKSLADFLKLTKNGKEEQSHSVYENVFESAFQMLKQVKKAEDKEKVKQQEGSSNSSSYKERLKQGSIEKYFGKKP